MKAYSTYLVVFTGSKGQDSVKFERLEAVRQLLLTIRNQEAGLRRETRSRTEFNEAIFQGDNVSKEYKYYIAHMVAKLLSIEIKARTQLLDFSDFFQVFSKDRFIHHEDAKNIMGYFVKSYEALDKIIQQQNPEVTKIDRVFAHMSKWMKRDRTTSLSVRVLRSEFLRVFVGQLQSLTKKRRR